MASLQKNLIPNFSSVVFTFDLVANGTSAADLSEAELASCQVTVSPNIHLHSRNRSAPQYRIFQIAMRLFASWMGPEMVSFPDTPFMSAFVSSRMAEFSRQIVSNSLSFKYDCWSRHKAVSHFYRICETCFARNLTSTLEFH